MEQKRDREQQRRRDKSSKDSKRGRTNKMDGKSSAPWRSKEAIEQEGMAGNSSSSTTTNDSENVNKSGGNFSKRQIESNWSKYEAILPGNDEVSKASDFESLMSAPISEGGHFKFRSEQSWEAYSPSQFNNLFTLDLNMLSTSLSTIPFYKQLNLSKDLFSQDELNKMEKEADENNARYNQNLKETVRTVSSAVPNKNTNTSFDKIVNPPQSHTIIEGLKGLKLASSADDKDSTSPENIKRISVMAEEILESEKDDELDFLLTLKEPLELPATLSKLPSQLDDKSINEEQKLQVPSTSSGAKQEDLEDWLDSILDD